MSTSAVAVPVMSEMIGQAAWEDLPAGARQLDARMSAVLLGPSDGSENLQSLYHKGTRNQWSIDDVDWSTEFDPANPLQLHDLTIPLAHTPIWASMDEKDRSAVRQHLQAWHVSQILHGERASMLCASKIMLASEDRAEKSCAALQAADEARHIEVYTRMLAKIGPEVSISPSLDRLLYDIIEDNEPGIVSLGLQIMVEGLALAFFRNLAAYSQNPLVRKVVELVIRDEARHFAAGQMSLRKLHQQLTEAELRRREDYVVEACSLLNDYLFADELWGPLGLPKQQCMELTRSSRVNRSMHRALFRSIVPAVRSIGLLGTRAQRTFEQMDVLNYASFPSTEDMSAG
jgi:hypothetical protein